MRSLALLMILLGAACSPPATWTPSRGSASELGRGRPLIADRPALYFDEAPAVPYHQTGSIEVWQSQLVTSSMSKLLESVRAEAKKQGCDGVLAKHDFIPAGITDDGRVGMFVDMYVHGELRVDGFRVAHASKFRSRRFRRRRHEGRPADSHTAKTSAPLQGDGRCERMKSTKARSGIGSWRRLG
jgi:hypothetical protein